MLATNVGTNGRHSGNVNMKDAGPIVFYDIHLSLLRGGVIKFFRVAVFNRTFFLGCLAALFRTARGKFRNFGFADMVVM